ncbi:ABC transporter substrate-binding protein [Niveibacterium umoris]|uniref:Putative spermidine/putrescine transport system substrate-binding protein n=1 Tax=Niveibacterium umoris TaxID=1193620 RepID=A0A840BKZ7_9RHOO|nr:extracellular solute-binding protein [Niveibacterium umoris]MBB4013925.1 putative spermidine/putrescine transport system substrate-binding protein [Niveibacterium umoris]
MTTVLRKLLPLLLALCLSPVALAGETLRVLTWPGYADPDWVQAFESRFKVSVEVTFVGSDDEMWERANSKAFDVIAANTAELQRYIDRELVVPLRLANVPNTQQQSARFRSTANIPGITRKGVPYAVPFTYSAMGIIYNRKLVPKAPASINALWDPKYRGKVLAYNGSSHNFSLAALSLGVSDPFHLSQPQFVQAENRLKQLRDSALVFYSKPEQVVELFRTKEVALVWANYGDQQVQQLEKAGADIGYVIPKEGALAWLDCWAVMRGAKNRALAEAWINFTLTPEVSAQLTARQGLANTLASGGGGGARPEDKLIWLEPVEDYPRRTQYWEHLMAGSDKAR